MLGVRWQGQPADLERCRGSRQPLTGANAPKPRHPPQIRSLWRAARIKLKSPSESSAVEQVCQHKAIVGNTLHSVAGCLHFQKQELINTRLLAVPFCRV
jgi:hypothetical protein